MNIYDASEQAYKRGYEAGQRDARKKGRWEMPSKYGMSHKFNHLGLVCSKCQKWSDNDYNYCPNCGADMRGEEDGT